MESDFTNALHHVLECEKGFQNDPRDEGNRLPDGRRGCTTLGVTQAVWESYVGHKVSTADMRALTPAKVAPLYKHKYWDVVNGDNLPSGVDYIIFDFAVNAGVGRAVKLLQTIVNVPSDGIIGAITLDAVKSKVGLDIIKEYTEAKKDFYRGLKAFPIYGAGWLTRAANAEHTAKTLLG